MYHRLTRTHAFPHKQTNNQSSKPPIILINQKSQTTQVLATVAELLECRLVLQWTSDFVHPWFDRPVAHRHTWRTHLYTCCTCKAHSLAHVYVISHSAAQRLRVRGGTSDTRLPPPLQGPGLPPHHLSTGQPTPLTASCII